ncbi:MAG: hypothetical protein EXS09_05630 [Gemmataceae bacterium]|nr:hypothetical protein [Gemmataceae bacterium]
MKRYLLLAVSFLMTGCFLKDFSTVARPQIDDAQPATDAMQIVSNVAAEFDNAVDMVISGYGIVYGLDGNGGATPPCEARTAISERLKREKYENPAEIIDSPDHAVVIVTAIVRPGVRRDELVDVEVTLPQGSKVKSLRGGLLQPTPLMTFASQGEVRDYLKQNDFGTVTDGNRLLKGHEVSMARGPIQSALGGKANESELPLKRGFVWKGAKMLESRAMYLVLKTDQQRYRVAEQVAKRINETFHAGDSDSHKVATAKHKDLVAVAVPARYRLNRPHYMRVVWAVPLSPPTNAESYVLEWEEKLNQPETALSAAIRLEALGAPGIPALNRGLKSDYPLVRFAAAEALAYQGQTSAADTLHKSASEHPALQAYALTALAALDDALSMSKLEDLLSAKEPELRYGAFRALREIDPNGDLIKGEWAKRSFVIHNVATPGSSLVHLLSEGRAEVVLFGESVTLLPPFSLTAGPNITVTARAGDKVATISRFSAKEGATPLHAQASLNVTEILKKLAEFGGTYNDAAEMLNKAHDRKSLSCPLVMDALPKAVPVKRLAEAARLDKQMEQEHELFKETDETSTPGLFAQKPEGDRPRD